MKVKKMLMSVLMIALIFMLTSCGYGVREGTVVDKDFIPEHTTHGTRMVRVGKVTTCQPYTIHHRDVWKIKIQKKDENDKILECWIDVTEEEYNKYEIGDYFKRDEE